ncbi:MULTISPECIES: metallophosphoesterase [Nocardia]|uniref:metallophosphoesterase n=1 Tax=Nocardia TaxID=1817 RepID=UPI001E64EF0B|nr:MULTISPECIES: metallophosphoesterase [Nocardia]
MTAIWLTSDLHVGHRMVAGLRGFGDDIDAHDATLAANWDRLVRPVDQVWLLGDLTGRRGDEARGLAWIAARPGVKHLIAGNHDAVHPLHSQAYKMLPEYLKVFATVQQSATRKIGGHRVLLSHFPYGGEGGDHTATIRYPEWRFLDTGRWLLHGHTHSPHRQRGRQLHVGVDAHGLSPVSLHWVEERIAEGISEVDIPGTIAS